MRLATVGLVTILSFTGMGQASAQTRIVTGRVTDSVTAERVTSGQVSVLGATTRATISNDGTFTLVAPARDVTLSVRSIGFKRRDIAVPASLNSVQVSLERDPFMLEAVVVTGQASAVERKNLANAVATVSAAELTRAPAASIENALQGKLTGALISRNSGAPGGGNIIRMRGVTSVIGKFTPLYVVDGTIVSDMSLGTGTNLIIVAYTAGGIAPKVDNQDNATNRIADLNPNDIESVEVLKGAAASAIYGSKASNGVILITTKRGRMGTPQFNVTQRVGVSELSKKVGMRKFSQAEAVQAFGGIAAQTYDPNAFYDWEQELYGGLPLSYETGLSASGGTERTKYFSSFLNKHDGGIVPNTFADKQSLRLSLDQTISSRLNVSASTDVAHTANDRGLTQNENNGAVIQSAMGYSGATWYDLRALCPDGTRKVQCEGGVYPLNPFGRSNPFQTAALFRNRESVWRIIGSGALTFDLVNTPRHRLQFLARTGGDVFTQKNAVFSPAELQFEPQDGLPGSSAVSFAQSQNFNVNSNLVHTFWTSGSSFTTQAGIQFETQDLDVSRSLAQGLIGGQENIDQALSVVVGEYRERVRDLGFFAQEEFLTLGERLLLTVGLRADQSSNNADTKHLHWYPKTSASYRVPGGGIFDELKVRAAFGMSGNQPLYGQKFTDLVAGNLGGRIATSAIQGVAGAPDLRPERQREIEAGIDATLFGSRASLEATVYEKRITDLLEQRSLTPTTGLEQLIFNGGSFRTRGLELVVSVLPVQTRTVQWTARGSFFLSRCRVVALPIPAFRPIAFINAPVFGATFIEEGKSCTQIIALDTVGAEPGDGALGLPIGTTITRGQTPGTKTPWDATPRYNASLANDVVWKDLRLYMLWDAQKGGVLSNITELEYDANQTSIDYVVPRKPGEATGEQRINAFGRTVRPYLQDPSYLKLREATLTYDLPQSVVRGLWSGARYVRLSLSARDLLLFTPYHTGDPEVNQIARSSARAVPWDIWAYPPSRSFWFSVDLGL